VLNSAAAASRICFSGLATAPSDGRDLGLPTPIRAFSHPGGAWEVNGGVR
jgi:hypothetical protein